MIANTILEELDVLHNRKNWKQNVDAPAQVVYANKLKEGAIDEALKNSFKVYKLTIVSLGSIF